jgi:hypothetical protein
MIVNHIENAPKMHSVYYYALRGKFFSTQIFFLHFALLSVTHSNNDHFNFAHVSITLISYGDSPLMKKFLVLFIQPRNMLEKLFSQTSCLSVSPSVSPLCDLSPFTITSVSASHSVSFVILSLYWALLVYAIVCLP